MRKIAILIGQEYFRNLRRYRAADTGIRAVASQLSNNNFFTPNEIIILNDRELYRNNRNDGNRLQIALSNLQLDAPYDFVLVYFIGYGFVNAETQERYLADLITDPKSLKETAVALTDLQNWIKGIEATDKLVFIDASWTPVWQYISENQKHADKKISVEANIVDNAGRNLVFAYSCKNGEAATQLRTSQQPLFTDYFLMGLRLKKRSANQLCDFICWQTETAVERERQPRQSPYADRSGPSDIWFYEKDRARQLRNRYYRIRSFRESFQTWLIGLSGSSIALFFAFVVFFPNQARLYSRQLDEQFNQLVGEQMSQLGQEPVMIAQKNGETVGTLVALPVDAPTETATTPPVEQTAGELTSETSETSETLPGLETDAEQTVPTEPESVPQEPIDQTNEVGVPVDSDDTQTIPQSSVPATAEEPQRLEKSPEPVSDPVQPDNSPLTAGSEPVQTDVIPETIQPTIVVETTPPATLGPVITEPFTNNINKTAATTPMGRSSITGSTPQHAETPKKVRDDSQDFIWHDNPQDRAPTMPRNFPKINDYGLR